MVLVFSLKSLGRNRKEMKTHTRLVLFILLLSIVFLPGCIEQGRYKAIEDADLITMNHTAAKALIEGAVESLIKGAVQSAIQQTNDGQSGQVAIKPLIITSFVNIDDLTVSSTFGRITSEQIGSCFSQIGYQVIEMKLRNSIFIKAKSGEFMLSRELRMISKAHEAQALLVGSYAVGSNSVYITAKLVNADNGITLSSYDYCLPIGPNTRALLRATK